ncbi:hypothetical protein CHARACLAT_031609 [Characodon lateralis]|uniref:Uncharacterized protein n=1 Tax=Characodon lateralis TaxID=208331 RepID=A0ABU7DLG2_9TELE|nr:hypothetical protein [Characodon lateralis]
MITFTYSFPASSLIAPHPIHLFTWLIKQHAGRQTAADYQSLSISPWLLISGHRPCFCLPTTAFCLTLGSACLNLPPHA